MFTGRSLALVQIVKYITKIYDYEIRNQFDISLNATYAKLSGKWNEVPKRSGVTVS